MAEPKSKKRKPVAKSEEEEEEEDKHEKAEVKPKAKKSDDDDDDGDDDDDDDEGNNQKLGKGAAKRNDQGEAYFDLPGKRRATVRKYKGSVFVDFREFYEKRGNLLPGKKGVTFSADQYQILADLVKSGVIKRELEKLSKK